jgi:tetratricopeptide (TPR) repeat protein
MLVHSTKLLSDVASLLLLTIASLAGRGQGLPPDALIKTAVEKYLAAYAGRDLNKVMAFWSSKSPDYDGWKDSLQKDFSKNARIEIKNLTFQHVKIHPAEAEARFAIEVAKGATKEALEPKAFVKQTRILSFVQEEGIWKVWRHESAERVLIDRLARAPSDDEIARLLAEEKQLIRLDFVDYILDIATNLAQDGRFSDAMRYNGLAFRGAEGLADKQARGHSYLNRGDLFYFQSLYEQALADYDRAVQVLTKSNHRDKAVEVPLHRARVYEAMGHLQKALSEYQTVLDQTAKRPPLETYRAAALTGLGNVRRLMSQYEEARQQFEAALQIARSRQDTRGIELEIRIGLGFVYKALGQESLVQQQFETCAQLAQAMNREKQIRVLEQFGEMDFWQGQYAAARPRFLAILEFAGKEPRFESQVASVQQKLATICRLNYQFDEALERYNTARELARKRRWKLAEMEAWLGRGLLHKTLGQDQMAEEALGAGKRLSRELGPDKEARVLLQIGELDFWAGRYREATTSYLAILALPEKESWLKGFRAYAHQRLGTILRERYQYEDALRSYQEALKIAEPERLKDVELEVRLGLGLLHGLKGQEAQARDQLQRAFDVAKGMGQRKEGYAWSQAGYLYSLLGNPKEARTRYERNLQLQESLQDKVGQASALNSIGDTYYDSGKYAEARPTYQKALAAAKAGSEVTARLEEARAQEKLGKTFSALGHYQEALTPFEAAQALYQAIRDRRGEARILQLKGNAFRQAGRYPEALQSYEQSLKTAQEAGDRVREASLRLDRAHVLAYSLGKLHEAVNDYRDAMRIAVEQSDERLQADVLMGIGDLFRQQGKRKDARSACYEPALKLVQKPSLYRQKVRLLLSFGNLAEDAGLYSKALADYEASLKLCREKSLRRDEAHALGALGGVKQSLGQYAEALARYDDQMRIARELNDQSELAAAHAAIGSVHLDQGQLAGARTAYQTSLDIADRIGLKSQKAWYLFQLGKVDRASGRLGEALERYSKSLEFAKANNIATPALHLSSYGELGSSSMEGGRNREAKQHYEKYLQLAHDAELRPREGGGHNFLGNLYMATGNYPAAASEFEKALGIGRETEDLLLMLGAQQGLAGVLLGQGKLVEARDLYESIGRTAQGKHLLNQQLTALIGSAAVDQARGDYAAALLKVNQEVDLAQKIGSAALEASMLLNRGDIYWAVGDLQLAGAQYLAGYNMALASFARPQQLAAKSRIAGIFLFGEKYPEARDRYREVRQMAHEMDRPIDQAHASVSLGFIALAMGDLGQVLPQCEEALQISQRLGAKSLEASVRVQLGRAHKDLGQALGRLAFSPAALTLAGPLAAVHQSRALQEFQKALDLAEPIAAVDTVLRAYGSLGDYYRGQQNWAKAARAYRKAIAVIEQVRLRTREPLLQTRFFARQASPYYGLIDCVLHQEPVEQAQQIDAFLLSERAKARTLVETMHRGRGNGVRGMSEEEKTREAALVGKITSLAQQLQSELPTDQIQKVEADLREARTEYQVYRDQLYLVHPSLQVRRAEFEPATLEQVWQSLFRGQKQLCLLSFLVGDEQTTLFALTEDAAVASRLKLSIYSLPLGRKVLEANVKYFLGVCSTTEKSDLRPDARQLYNALLAPAAKEMRGKTHLVIIPDGILHLLPFQALWEEQAGKGCYLIEKYALSYAPSVTALVKMIALAAPATPGVSASTVGLLGSPLGQGPFLAAFALLPATMLAMGNPTNDLPHTEDEVKRIAALFGTNAWIGKKATESRARKVMGWVSYIHLATHAETNDLAPLHSQVNLARDQDYDGILYAYELLDLTIRARLVVVSACKTASGASFRGEGILGLSWALFVAGTPSSILSQWEVISGASTTELMVTFYREFLHGQGDRSARVTKAEALRRAQRQVMAKYPHPYYWAPFVLLGDWR